MNWERIDDWHLRAKVFGGWLVKAHESVYHLDYINACGDDGWDFRVAMAYVPDVNHEWKIEEVAE